MPLPLLMGLGMGLLGGGQYLLHKMDQRASASMLDQFRNQVLPQAGDFGQQYGGQYLALAEGLANSGGLLNRTSDQVSSLLSDFLGQSQRAAEFQQGYQQTQQWNAAQLAQRVHENDLTVADRDRRFRHEVAVDNAQLFQNAGQAGAMAGFAETERLQNTTEQMLSRFQNIDIGYRQLRSALESNNPQDSTAAVFKFMNTIEPGGMVRDSETGMIRGAGGVSAQVAGYLNELQGKGFSPTVRRDLADAALRLYNQEYKTAQGQREWIGQRLEQYRRAGLDVWDPRGSLGIEWGGYQPQTFQDAPAPGGAGMNNAQAATVQQMIEQGGRLEPEGRSLMD